jgi:UDPglucose 6-dehydrogenase
MESSRIFIVGSGVVGAATGEGFLAAGHKVTFIDVSAPRVAELASRGLDVRTELDLAGEPESFIFLTLPTPNDGHRYDLTAFTAGTAAVGKALAVATARNTVVVRSTVPPGTTESLVRSVLEENSGLTAGAEFALASNPEFLRAASAAEDFANPWMTVIASRDSETFERMRALLSPFGGELRAFENPAEAEFVKCAHNIFNATKISFGTRCGSWPSRSGWTWTRLLRRWPARQRDRSTRSTGSAAALPTAGCACPRTPKASSVSPTRSRSTCHC